MRKVLLILPLIALLLMGATDCQDGARKNNRDNNIVHSENPDPPQGGWKQFPDTVRLVKLICEGFRANSNTQLTTGQTEANITQYASRDGIPGELTRLVGEYYGMNITPTSPDGEARLRQKKDKLLNWCSDNHV